MKKYKLLVVVDMQNDFVTGTLANPAAEAIVPDIAEYMKSAAADGFRMIMTADRHQSSNEADFIEHDNVPTHRIFGTEGCDIVQPLLDIATTQFPDDNWDIVYKNTFAFNPNRAPWEILLEMSWAEIDSLSREDVENHLEKIYICGVCTDICVISNALMLRSLFPRVPVYVLSKLCAGTSREAHEAALQVMKNNCITVV